MKRGILVIALTVLANAVLAAMVYGTIGWHFIRGYNEVGNFAVVPAAIILAAVNVLIAIVVAIVGWVAGWWRRGGLLSSLLIGLSASAVAMLLSPLYVPPLGEIAKRNLWIDTPIVEAARYGDAGLVMTLLEEGANPNARQAALGTTPLHYMAARGEQEAVTFLLEKGADPNARAFTSLESPLHWGVYHYRYEGRVHLSTIETLLKYGADPTLKDWKGRTPIDCTDVIPEPEKTQILRLFGRQPIGPSKSSRRLRAETQPRRGFASLEETHGAIGWQCARKEAGEHGST